MDTKALDIKLIAFDLDGTLLDRQARIPPINVRALKKCSERGILLMLCSGRAFEVQASFAREAGIAPIFASANGARIDLDGSGEATVCENTLEISQAQRIYDTLMERGIYFMVYCRGRAYVANEEEQRRLGKHRHAPGITMYGAHPYEIVCDKERLRAEALGGAYKFVCFGEDYDARFEDVRAQLSDMRLSISSSWRDNIEIMRPGVDKGFAVSFVAQMHGIPMENVMAFGDNSNDMSMLEKVGWPVAMENGEAEVLRLARLTAPDHNAGGVGIALNEYVLGGN